MSTDNPDIVSPVDGVERLPSLAALQIVHKELLQAHRQEGDTAEMLDRIEGFIHQGQATGAVLDDEQERWTAQGVLDYWSATLFRADRRAPDATLVDFDPELAPELADELCPYVGLDPFREATQGEYFGRERLIGTLIEKLADSRLLAVVGPSGSGKSSVVLAGLLPALKRGVLPDSDAWRYVPPMVPGSNPLANLARLIQSVGIGAEEDPIEWAHEQERLLRQNPRHLLDLVEVAGDMPIVGVVDQFEEVFTLCSDQQARQAFIDNLTNLVQEPGARHTVIITMRSDFEPFVARMPDFYSLFEQALVRVTPLSASELREAIEKPAEKVGLKFESGIVDLLLQDLLGEPAGLPLLQFTLLKLWESRTRNRITWEAYNRLGSGRLALARSADAFYDELIPEEQVTAKRIFLRLVRPGEGLEFTSNRVRLRTLYQAGEAQYRVDQVLDKLIAAHLLRVSEGDVAADIQVEVAHEALVRNWPRLVDWLEEERHNIRRRQSVGDAAERWIASGRDPGALYTTETLLQEALRVVEASGVSLNEQEAGFIRASEQAQEAARNEQEATRQRELKIERQRADEQAAAAKRFKRVAVALVIVGLFAVAAFLAVLWSQNMAAESNTALAQARQAEAEFNAAEAKQRRAAAETAEAFALQAQELALAGKATAEANATQAATNLKDLRDSLGDQEGLIDQLATAEAQKAAISGDVQSATATVAALATLRSEVQATQTAVSCDMLRQYIDQAIRYCGELNSDWICLAGGVAEVEPSSVRFFLPGDRAVLRVFSSIQTVPPDGVVVARVQLLAEFVTLIIAQNSVYVVRVSNGGETCELAPPTLVVYTKIGEPGRLNINGVLIELR